MKTLKLSITLFFVTLFSFANISPSEKEALLALYNATKGSEWNTTWDLKTPADTWYGVTVENDQVVELKLHFNNLQGKLPNEIGNLIHLRNLNLGFNKLTGTIPNEIYALSKLEKFSVMDNKMDGEIPTEIAQLSNLEELLLSSNQFTGDLPQEFMGLTNLNLIMVSDNNLNNEYTSYSGNNPPDMIFLELQNQNATANMDLEKE